MHFRCIRLLTPFQQQAIAWTEPELPPRRIRRHLHPAIQRHQQEDLIGQPATPAELVAPTSPHTNTVNQILPTQCAQDHAHPSIEASRPRRTVRPPKRAIEKV